MILYFSGTGNSRYAAQRMADALGEPLLCLNDRIKAGDTAPIETGARLILVTPTYAWRIPPASWRTGCCARSLSARGRRGSS